MTNPILISTPFATAGGKNTIQESVPLEPNNPTWLTGFPTITNTPVSEGGLPPKRLDFNGVLNAVTENTVHLTKGLGYEFDATYATKIGGYPLHAVLTLTNGDRVQSTVANNIIDPNIDMTGWRFDDNTVESIADLLAIPNPKNGSRVYVKSYYAGLNKGGDRYFTYDSSKSTINNLGTIINGWVSQHIATHTPEMWGAIGGGLADDTFYINNMLQTLSGYEIGTNVPYSKVQNTLLWAKKFTVQFVAIYRHTKTIWLPAGCTLKQESEGRWSESIRTGLFFDPPVADYNTAGLSTLEYVSNEDGDSNATSTFRHISDPLFIPSGDDFDNGTYITYGWDVLLENTAMMCNKNALIGFNLSGFFGKTKNICIGNRYEGRFPKVGLVHKLGWCGTHHNPRIMSSVQGFVGIGSTAGVSVYNPWISRFPHSGDKSSDVTPIFNPSNHTEKGTIGITLIESQINFESPTYEAWTHGVVAEDCNVHINLPHFESVVAKHEFYLINSSANINLRDNFGIYTESDTFADYDGSQVTYRRSAIHLKNCNFPKDVVITGNAQYGVWRILTGENSGKVVSMYTSPLNDNFKYYKFGDLKFLKDTNFGKYYSTVYLDSTNGDDENLGFYPSKPRKTFSDLDILLHMDGISNVSLRSSITLNVILDLPSKAVTFMGTFGNEVLSLGECYFKMPDNSSFTYASFKISNISSVANQAAFYIGYNAHAKIIALGQFDLKAQLAIAEGISDIDLLISNSLANCTAYYHARGLSSVGINVASGAVVPATPITGAYIIKYKSSNL